MTPQTAQPLDPQTVALILALQPSAAIGSTRECKLCRHPAHHFDYVDFQKSCNSLDLHRSGICVEYFRCQRCELIFTDFFDKWSSDDFSKHIYNDDYVLVDPDYTYERPFRAAKDLAPSLACAENHRILDYGSGTGTLERELRLSGFSAVESYDPFSQPSRPLGRFDIITCMDVIEHAVDPRATLLDLRSLLAPGGCMLIGQTLQPADIASCRGRWWYMSPRNGHLTMYSCETLRIYAEENGLRYVDFGNLFALVDKAPSALTEQILERRHPQQRHLELFAPREEALPLDAWHPGEDTPVGRFRWTRAPTVSFGLEATPRGLLRITFRFLGVRDREFLSCSKLRVGSFECPLSFYEDTAFAVFDFPIAGRREIVLQTPAPYSEAAAGRGDDLRPVGIAIACQPDPVC